MKQIKLLALTLSCLFFSDIAFALRCEHTLIKAGDQKADVYAKCGDPESVESHIERRGSRNLANGIQFYPNSALSYGQQQYEEVEVVVEEWIYNFGHSRFQQYLRFENGKLREIRNLGRGR